MKRVDVAIAIVRKGQQVLICQRRDDDSFGGYWEFPGGKVECGESLEACLAREMQEELAIQVLPKQQLATIEHDYDQVQVRLHPFICDHHAGEPQLIEVQDVRWVLPAELRNYKFPEANDELIEEVIRQLER